MTEVREVERTHRWVEDLLKERPVRGTVVATPEDARLWALLRALKGAARPEALEPDPTFVRRLEGRLRRRWALGRLRRHLAVPRPLRWAAAGLVALLLLTWAALQPPAAEGPTPFVRAARAQGVDPQALGRQLEALEAVRWVLDAALPAIPEALPGYGHGDAAALAARMRAALGLTDPEPEDRSFGWGPPRTRWRGPGGTWLQLDLDRGLTFRYRPLEAAPAGDPVEAARRALAGWWPPELTLGTPRTVDLPADVPAGRGLLPAVFLDDEGDLSRSARQIVRFPQTLGGIEVEGAGILVWLDAERRVLAVDGRLVVPVRRGEVPLLKPKAAWDRFTAHPGDRFLALEGRRVVQLGQDVVVVAQEERIVTGEGTRTTRNQQVLLAPLSPYTPGQVLTATGRLRLQASLRPDGQPRRVMGELIPDPGSPYLRLTDLPPESLGWPGMRVAVTGTVVRVDPLTLQVERIARLDPREVYTLTTGILGEDGRTLLGDDGRTYRLEGTSFPPPWRGTHLWIVGVVREGETPILRPLDVLAEEVLRRQGAPEEMIAVLRGRMRRAVDPRAPYPPPPAIDVPIVEGTARVTAFELVYYPLWTQDPADVPAISPAYRLRGTAEGGTFTLFLDAAAP